MELVTLEESKEKQRKEIIMKSNQLTRFAALWAAGILAATTVVSAQQQQPPLGQQRQLEQREPGLQQQQERGLPGEVSEERLKKEVTKINRSSEVVGMDVRNLENERLATVNDLVFDFESGRIAYAVLSVGGFLGIGDKLVAIPFEILKPAQGEEHLLLNVSKDRLAGAPGFAKDNYPSLDTRAWGAEAGWAEAGHEGTMYRGQVKDLDVEQGKLVIQGPQGEREFKIHQQTVLHGPGQQVMQLDRLQHGQFVMVHYEDRDGQMLVQKITIEQRRPDAPGQFERTEPRPLDTIP
jgi:sporulation protein YlmC with PRC-barrel domain